MRLKATALAVLVFAILGASPKAAKGTKPAEPIGGAISVASINLAKETDVERIALEIEAAPALRNADVFLLQEVVKRGPGQPSSADRLAARLGLNIVFASPNGAHTEGGLAVLSKHPIDSSRVYALKACNLVYRSRQRIALAATVRAPSGAVRVIDTHLDTRITLADRLEQLKPVIDDAKSFEGPRIIGGDFNTNNIRWLAAVVPIPFAQVHTGAVQRLMKENGFSTPFANSGPTFDLLGLRLDWIFHQNLETRASGIQPLKFSDHHAIWAQMVPVNTTTASR